MAMEEREAPSTSYAGVDEGELQPLMLGDPERLALQALQAFAETLSTAAPFEGQSGSLSPDAFLGTAALVSASQTIQQGLPPCPWPPLGVSVTPSFVPPDNRLVLRCSHSPAHCWDDFGQTPYNC